MAHRTRAFCTLTALVVAALSLSPGSIVNAQRENEEKKPSVSLKATPPVGFSPLRVRVTVDLRGGPDDYADLYCPAVQWEWGDDVTSENSEDCDPYQAGKSSIKRHYSAQHIYRQAGGYKITFRLKQRDRVIAAGTANIQVRAGLRDDFGS
jgi:hypothetical protein